MVLRTPTSSLTSKLASRRARQEADPSLGDVHKHRDAMALVSATHDRVATLLANDIAVALAAQIEEISTYNHGFRSALIRVFLRVLALATSRPDPVVIFHEAIPGFTLMLFKKATSPEPMTADPSPPAAAVGDRAVGAGPEVQPTLAAAPTRLEATAEGRAAEVLIGTFFQRTGHRVLVIEHRDSLFVFFPATDLRKNVRELGYLDME